MTIESLGLVQLFTKAGAQKPLHSTRTRAMTWREERYGGWDSFTLTVNAEPGEDLGIENHDRIEFWWRGLRVFRGYVEEIERAIGDPGEMTVSGYGISFLAGKPTIRHAYAYSTPVDLSRAFADIVTEYVTPILPDIALLPQDTGAIVSRVEADLTAVREALNDLTQTHGENRALWGGKADDDGADLLYIKPFDSVVSHAFPVPGWRTNAARNNVNSADVVTRLTIRGGNPRYPNLLYNASFERPMWGGEASGNMVGNPGFEVQSDDPGHGIYAYWSGSGSYKASGGGTGEGSPYSGDWMWETDNGGENAAQTQNPASPAIVEGRTYTFGARAKAETSDSTAYGSITLTWLDVGGSPIVGYELVLPSAASGDGDRLSVYWTQFQKTVVAPAGATGFLVEVKCTAGGGAGEGILWDEVEVYDANQVFQDKWELVRTGTGVVNAVDWIARPADGVFDGGYCVYLDVTASDVSNAVVLQPSANARMDIAGGAEYLFMVRVRAAPGASGAIPQIRLELNEYDSSGNLVGDPQIYDLPTTLATETLWYAYYVSKEFAQTSTQASVRILFLSAGEVYIDATSLRDSAAPLDEYIREGDYVATIPLDTLAYLDALSTAVEAAAEALAVDVVKEYRDAVVQASGITQQSEARTYAAAYFNAHALTYPLPKVTVIDPLVFPETGELARLIGEDGEPLMTGPAGAETGLPIVRAEWTWDDTGLKGTLELQKEVPDEADLLLKRLERLLGNFSSQQSSSSAGSTSGYSSGAVLSIAGEAPITVTPDPIVGAGTVGIDDFEGDAGTGGARGAVPAPAAGDAAAGKVLGAAGTWIAQSGGILQGLDAALPAAGTEGRVYYATDTHILYRDNGATWDHIQLDHAEIVGLGTAALADTGDFDAAGLAAAAESAAESYADAHLATRDVADTAPSDGDVMAWDDTGGTWAPAAPGGGGAPSNAHFVTTQAEAGLSNEADLGSLTSGLLKHTVAGGVSTPATASAGTDYSGPPDGTTLEDNSGSTRIKDAGVSNAKLANMASKTFKGRHSALTGVPEDVSAADLTADLDAMVGDTGTGGTKGLVPAPGAGDAEKFLRGDASWAESTGGMTNPMSQVADMIVGGTAGAPARLAKGDDGQVLRTLAGVQDWDDDVRQVTLGFDGGGFVVTTNSYFDVPIEFPCTILRAVISGEQSGSAVIDLLRASSGGFPTFASITGGSKPTLTNQQRVVDNSLSGWTVTLAEGDTLRAHVDSCSTIQKLSLVLKVKRA